MSDERPAERVHVRLNRQRGLKTVKRIALREPAVSRSGFHQGDEATPKGLRYVVILAGGLTHQAFAKVSIVRQPRCHVFLTLRLSGRRLAGPLQPVVRQDKSRHGSKSDCRATASHANSSLIRPRDTIASRLTTSLKPVSLAM